MPKIADVYVDGCTMAHVTCTEQTVAVICETEFFQSPFEVNCAVNQAISQAHARIPWLTSWLTLTRCRKDQTIVVNLSVSGYLQKVPEERGT